MVHSPTCTAIYIDAARIEGTRTIMRAELVAIHKAFTMFASREWIEMFNDSLSSLQAIRRHNTNSGTRSSLHYHHQMLLLGSITDLLETKKSAGFGRDTILQKSWAHTNIRGNNLADAVTELAVWNFDTLPPAQTMRVDIGEIAPRPSHWVMYTASPPRFDPALPTGTNNVALRHP